MYDSTMVNSSKDQLEEQCSYSETFYVSFILMFRVKRSVSYCVSSGYVLAWHERRIRALEQTTFLYIHYLLKQWLIKAVTLIVNLDNNWSVWPCMFDDVQMCVCIHFFLLVHFCKQLKIRAFIFSSLLKQTC